jgi:hypothetical protein
LIIQGISYQGYTLIFDNYFFAGAGAAFSGAGAALSGAGAALSGAGAAALSGAGASFAGSGAGAGFASSFGGAGFGGSDGPPQPIREKLAKKEIAINNTTSFFIFFHLLSLFR